MIEDGQQMVWHCLDHQLYIFAHDTIICGDWLCRIGKENECVLAVVKGIVSSKLLESNN